MLQIEFESALPELTVAEVPSYVSDNGTSLVLVGDRAGNITINGTAPAPGYYVIVLHYFQPYYPSKYFYLLTSGASPTVSVRTGGAVL